MEDTQKDKKQMSQLINISLYNSAQDLMEKLMNDQYREQVIKNMGLQIIQENQKINKKFNYPLRNIIKDYENAYKQMHLLKQKYIFIVATDEIGQNKIQVCIHQDIKISGLTRAIRNKNKLKPDEGMFLFHRGQLQNDQNQTIGNICFLKKISEFQQVYYFIYTLQAIFG